MDPSSISQSLVERWREREREGDSGRVREVSVSLFVQLNFKICHDILAVFALSDKDLHSKYSVRYKSISCRAATQLLPRECKTDVSRDWGRGQSINKPISVYSVATSASRIYIVCCLMSPVSCRYRYRYRCLCPHFGLFFSVVLQLSLLPLLPLLCMRRSPVSHYVKPQNK